VTSVEKVLCDVYGKIDETFWFLLYHFVSMANLVNVGTQDEQTDAHSSKSTTQVALGYQQIDQKDQFRLHFPPARLCQPFL